MPSRGILAALVLLVALGGFVWYSNRRPMEPRPGEPGSAVKIFSVPVATVAKLEIARRDGETTVLDKSSGVWKLIAPEPLPLDAESSVNLLNAIAGVEAEKVVDEKATDWASYGLDQPLTRFTVTLADGKQKRFAIGDDAPTGSGAYVRVEGDPRLFTIPSFTKLSLDKKAADLRDKRLIPADLTAATSLSVVTPAETAVLSRLPRGEWRIEKPIDARADGFQVEQLLARLGTASIDSAQTPEDSKQAASDFAAAAPFVSLVVVAGEPLRLEVRKTKAGKYLVRSSSVTGTYPMLEESALALGKSSSDLRNKRLFAFGFNDPAKVEVKTPGRGLSLNKSGELWVSGGKAMDSVGVQSLIDKLRDLQATGFRAGSLPVPETEITVISDGGKRTEKVSIAKAGSSYLARLDGDSSLYVLDPIALTELIGAVADIREMPPPPPAQKKK